MCAFAQQQRTDMCGKRVDGDKEKETNSLLCCVRGAKVNILYSKGELLQQTRRGITELNQQQHQLSDHDGHQ